MDYMLAEEAKRAFPAGALHDGAFIKGFFNLQDNAHVTDLQADLTIEKLS
jgi:hypothetical protein